MLFSSAGPTMSQKRNRRSVPLEVERLEDRCVLSAVPASFTQQLYTDLLQRAPDSQGLNIWNTLLAAGLSTTDVAQGFVNSPEFQANEVASLYGKLLHRGLDPLGRGVFLPILAAGGNVQQVEAMILASDEFFATQGGGTNDGFLKAVFLNVLDRSPDPLGEQVFMQELALGTSRLTVATQIATSPEGLQDLVNSYYMAYLNRPAEAGGLAFFVGDVQHGARIEDVIAMVTGSPEYVTFSTGASNPSRINPESTPFSNPFAGTYAGQFSGTASGVDMGNSFSEDVSGPITLTIDNNGKITFYGQSPAGSGSGTGTVNPSGSSGISLATGLGTGVSSEGSGSGSFTGTGVLSGSSATFTGTWTATGHSSTGSGQGSASGTWTAVRQK